MVGGGWAGDWRREWHVLGQRNLVLGSTPDIVKDVGKRQHRGRICQGMRRWSSPNAYFCFTREGTRMLWNRRPPAGNFELAGLKGAHRQPTRAVSSGLCFNRPRRSDVFGQFSYDGHASLDTAAHWTGSAPALSKGMSREGDRVIFLLDSFWSSDSSPQNEVPREAHSPDLHFPSPSNQQVLSPLE